VLLGPFVIKVDVVFSDDDGNEGTATFRLPPGRIPSEERLISAIGECIESLDGTGLRLMDGEQFFNWLAEQRTGRKCSFGAPPDFNFDVDALTHLAVAALAAKRSREKAEKE